MKLESVEDRLRLIDRLLKKTFKNDALWIHGEENYGDWAANMDIMTDLLSIDELVHTEKIFLDAFDDMAAVRTRFEEERSVYLTMTFEGLTQFVDEVLLQTLETTFDNMNELEFKTELGQKFHKDIIKKFDALIKNYQDEYDL